MSGGVTKPAAPAALSGLALLHERSRGAEADLLACLLADPEREIPDCVGAGVTAASFLGPDNRLLFSEILGLHGSGVRVDTNSLIFHLRQTGRLEDAGGATHVADIGGAQGSALYAGQIARCVRNFERMREVARIAERLSSAAFEAVPDRDPLELFGGEFERLSGVLSATREARDWPGIVDEAEAIARARMDGTQSGAAFTVSWGFPDLDKTFGQMEAGELVLPAARTSVGKSSLMRQVSVGAAQRGEPVLVSSLEVTDVEMATNLAANVSGVRSRRDLDRLGHEERAELLRAFDSLRGLQNFAVCDRDSSLVELIARAKAFKARHGLRLWAIDYLQLIRDTKAVRGGERVDQAIGRVTSELKNFAVQENVVVMLLSQLNRSSDKEGNRQPRLSDLRDSGRIEEDANRVVFLHRPDKYDLGAGDVGQSASDDKPLHFIRLIQAKGRNHGTGSVGMMFHRKTATFRQIALSDKGAGAEPAGGQWAFYSD
jgi:replicative DNA helicase